MKIVVLDGYPLNVGDLSWNKLEELGEVVIYDHTPVHQIVDRAKDADIILTNKTPLDHETIVQLSRLQYIGVLATGYDNIDIETAQKQGIVVTNIPSYSTNSVAQLTFSLILELCQHVAKHSQSVHQGEWASKGNFSYWLTPQIELAGKTIGIIGYGNIGEKVAQIASAFDMDILAFRRHPREEIGLPKSRWASLEEIYTLSDVISLHCPLTPETEHLIRLNTLKKMKKSAFLINTARGQLIKEEDLAYALKEGIIAGAGLDVLSEEPPQDHHPLININNCIITPHMAWATIESRQRCLQIAIQNIDSFLAGEVQNEV